MLSCNKDIWKSSRRPCLGSLIRIKVVDVALEVLEEFKLLM